jgi:Tol biopolymer transport system component
VARARPHRAHPQAAVKELGRLPKHQLGCFLHNIVDMKIKIATSILFLLLITSCASSETSVFSGSSGYVVYSSVVDQETTSEEIFIKDLATGSNKQLTISGNNQYPSWSPDGSKILFVSFTKENLYDIYIMGKDGNNKTPIISTSANEREADFSPSGNEVVFVSDKDGNDEIYKINLQTKNVARLSNSVFYEAFPKWSPSGNSIVFVSFVDGGRTQVYTMDTSGANIKKLTDFTLEGFDRDPVWCPDESCVIFTRLSNPDKLMRFDFNTGELTNFLDGDKFDGKDQGFPARSPVSGYITFYMLDSRESYAMDLISREIYPLGVKAASFMLYP